MNLNTVLSRDFTISLIRRFRRFLRQNQAVYIYRHNNKTRLLAHAT